MQNYQKYSACLVLLFGAVLVLTLFTQTVVASAETSSPWPQNVTQVGINPNLNIVWGSAISSDVNWTFDTHGDNPFTHVIVVDGIAYVGSMMNKIYALDAVTGKQIWQFEADNWIMTNPVVVNGRLYAGSGNRFYRSPGDQGGWRGTGSNSFYAIDAKTGKEIWRYKVPGEAMPTPVYKDGILYFVVGDRSLYAINAEDGTLLYQYYLGSVFSMSSINIDGNILVFGGGYPSKTFGFDITTRKLAWEHSFPDIYFGMDDSIPAIANGTLYINGVGMDTIDGVTRNPHHEFIAMDTQTGQVKWSFKTTKRIQVDDNKSTMPAIVDGVYYGGSSMSEYFYAIDATTGALKWQFDIGQPIKGGPDIISDYVIFADTKGNVFALNRYTGQLVAKKALGGGVAPQGPTIFNGTLYVPNQNGKVYAFSVASLLANGLTAPVADNNSGEYFAATSHNVKGAILAYWQQNGGLSQFGYPLTEEISEYHAAEGVTYTVQYFERARFELHANQVMLGRLGSEITSGRTDPAFQVIAKPSDKTTYFSETGHTVLNQFYTYWQQHGGLAIYGYPISEPFQEVSSDGKTYTVQYFERARFELHSDTQVLIGLLGVTRLTGRT